MDSRGRSRKLPTETRPNEFEMVIHVEIDRTAMQSKSNNNNKLKRETRNFKLHSKSMKAITYIRSAHFNSPVILYKFFTLTSTQILAALLISAILISSIGVISNAEQQGPEPNVAPTIDYSHNMRILKLPKSLPVGSLVYRLRGSDGNSGSQLMFGVSGLEARSLLDVKPVGKSWNEADVYLRSPLEGSHYNLSVYVTDGNMSTQVESTILVVDDISPGLSSQELDSEAGSEQQWPPTTNLEPWQGFGGASLVRLSPFVSTRSVLQVPENAMPNEIIGSVMAQESLKSDLPVRFELRGKGAEKFAIRYVFGPKAGLSKADIVLSQKIDYEKQNLFNLQVLALNAWTNSRYDTRNVATMDLVISVADVQDTPPKFTQLPQIIRLANSLKINDIVAKVEAEDGDYADQRPVEYALDASSPLASFFDIDKSSGEIRMLQGWPELATRLMHQTNEASPIVSSLTVLASETPDTSSYDHLWPPMVSRAEISLALVDQFNEAPRFVGALQTLEGSTSGSMSLAGQTLSSSSAVGSQGSTKAQLQGYVTEAMVGAALAAASGVQTGAWTPLVVPVIWRLANGSSAETFASSKTLTQHPVESSLGLVPSVLDLGAGSNGTFELSLEGADAHLLRVEPSFPVVRRTPLALNLVLGPTFANTSGWPLESEWRSGRRRALQATLVARDFGTSGRLASRLECRIELIGSQVEAPQFDQASYSFSVPENAVRGQLVGIIRARDPDGRGPVRYPNLEGLERKLFSLNEESGELRLAAPLDRESRHAHLLLAEARGPEAAGVGVAHGPQPWGLRVGGPRSNWTQVLVSVVDVNDEAPQFAQAHYAAALLPDGRLDPPLLVAARDADEPGSANSQLAYEIVAGNTDDLFAIDSSTGALYLASAGAPAAEVGGARPALQQQYPALQIPPLPPVLSEPIRPFGGRPSSGGPLTGSGSLATGSGKTLVPQHEVEETTVPSGLGRGRTFPQPREAGPAAAGRSHAPLGPRPDAEQLPALDLLLGLESRGAQFLDEASWSGAPATPATPNLATRAVWPDTRAAPPFTSLVVRAHDFGVPVKSSSVRVSIYNLALQSRSLSVILNATSNQVELKREPLERAFGSLTGSRASIEAVDTLSESSQLSVVRFRLAAPHQSLIDLTDISALISALDYHLESGRSSAATSGHAQQQLPPAQVTHYIATPDHRLIPAQVSPNASSIATGSGALNDIGGLAIDWGGGGGGGLERRLLIYIIIVAVCILSLLVIWMIYSCSRESDQLKIIEKSADSGRHIHQRQPPEPRPTAVKSTVDAAVQSSAIGNNLSKGLPLPVSSRGSLGSQAGGMASLMAPRLLPKDQHSMYNGQVWFEPAPGGGVALARNLANAASRRASSAPSAGVGGGSLDTALHSALGSRLSWRPLGPAHQLAGTPGLFPSRNQFFPNTVGYVDNLAALLGTPPELSDGGYRRLSGGAGLGGGGGGGGGYRARNRVAPAGPDFGERPPAKPARAGQAAPPGERPAGSALSRSSAVSSSSRATSSSAEEATAAELVLDSDQELLGFDPTGTPIIATHTRAKPLVIDLLGKSATGGAPAIGHAPAPATGSGAVTGTGSGGGGGAQPGDEPSGSTNSRGVHSSSSTAASVTTGGTAAAGGTSTTTTTTTTATTAATRTTTTGSGETPSGTAAARVRPRLGQALQVAPARPPQEAGAPLERLDERQEPPMAPLAPPPPGGRSTEMGGAEEAAAERRRRDFRRASSQGNLMGELSERLSKRQQRNTVDEEHLEGGGARKGEGAGPGPPAPLAEEPARAGRSTLTSASGSEQSQALPEVGGGERQLRLQMRNGELLEKSSIFALTYNGVSTNKLPG